MDILQLPPTGIIDSKVCTPADPNGTKSRIYTQSVSAPRLPLPEDEGLGPIQFKSVKTKVNFGTNAEGDASIDENGNVDWNGKAKYQLPEKGKKIKFKVEANVEVCVKKKNGREDGKGSWFTYEVQALGFYNKAGHPDGDFCIGVGSDYLKPEGSIEPG